MPLFCKLEKSCGDVRYVLKQIISFFLPFFWEFSWPRKWTLVSHIVGKFFTVGATREAQRVQMKIKMWKIGIYTATLEHKNSLLWSHFITSYPSHWILRTSGCLLAFPTHTALVALPAHKFPKIFTARHSQPEPKVVHFTSVLLVWLLQPCPCASSQIWSSPIIHRSECSASNPVDWIHRDPLL